MLKRSSYYDINDDNRYENWYENWYVDRVRRGELLPNPTGEKDYRDFEYEPASAKVTHPPSDPWISEYQLEENSLEFSEQLSTFLNSFEKLLMAKNKAYGNSALEPMNVFSKASSAEVISQQIDHKISRIKNSEEPVKNDVIDLMGYLTLYCLNQQWLDLKDLYD